MIRFYPFCLLIHRSFGSATSKASALKTPKRFYQRVDICKVEANGQSSAKSTEMFGIRLDARALRTPRGQTLRIPESLALLLSQEWEAQKDEIRHETMHLTGLAFTAIDNPCNETKDSLVEDLLNFLRTDTILYFADQGNSLSDEQRKYWGPIILWANSHFGLSLHPTDDLVGQPQIPKDSIATLERHLRSFNFASLVGISYATEAIKSLLLTLAALSPQFLDAESAVKLARLEQIHQTKTWKAVEWAHDIDHFEQCSRLSAALLFVHCYHHCHPHPQ